MGEFVFSLSLGALLMAAITLLTTGPTACYF